MAPKLQADTLEAGHEAAKAIMTTDTDEKEVAVQIEIGGKTVTIGGMCKGSGMIHPNMCTMLGFVTTDACISKAASAGSTERRMLRIPIIWYLLMVILLQMIRCFCWQMEWQAIRRSHEKNEDYQKFCEALELCQCHTCKEDCRRR